MKSGILLLNKPTGISSARVINPLKRIYSGRRIGHTGTLDPFADGLLVVLVGAATRLSRWFLKLDKRYTATLALGRETDTLDTEGEVVAEAPIPPIAEVCTVASRFHGEIEQIPPAYSALKVDGRRAYDRARRGETVDLPSRTVTIHDLAIRPGADESGVELNVACSSGTYIRALARDIARAAGTRGYCSALRRVSVGPFCLDEATTVDRLASDGAPDRYLIDAARAVERLGTLPIVPVPPPVARQVANGTPVERLPALAEWVSAVPTATDVLVTTDSPTEALAVLQRSGERWRYATVFPGVEVAG